MAKRQCLTTVCIERCSKSQVKPFFRVNGLQKKKEKGNKKNALKKALKRALIKNRRRLNAHRAVVRHYPGLLRGRARDLQCAER